MKTLHIALALVIALLVAMPGAAQNRQKKRAKSGRLSPRARVMMRLEKMREAVKDLELTTEQEGKFSELREELGPKMKEVFGRMRDLLSQEQRDAAEEAIRLAKDAGKKGRAFFLSVESSVTLTDEQKGKMAEIDKQMLRIQRQMMKKVMGILTPAQQEKLKKKLAPTRNRARKKGNQQEK